MYASYFGLSEQPFNLTPDPRFFYATPRHEEVYANLFYGIQERKGSLVLIGEPGTGKTSILRRLMAELPPTVRTTFFYHTTLTFDELLDFVCRDFGVQVKGKRRLDKIQALNGFLLARLEEGGTSVLVIDEAHNLTDEILENLRLLSNFETSTQKLLQIVLAGQPELARKLSRPELRQLKQRIAIYCELNRLRAQAVGPFIAHRLQIAGCGERTLFSPGAIQRITVYSDGVPRIINTLCDNALLAAYRSNQQTVSEQIIEEVAQDLALKRRGPGFPYGRITGEGEALRTPTRKDPNDEANTAPASSPIPSAPLDDAFPAFPPAFTASVFSPQSRRRGGIVLGLMLMGVTAIASIAFFQWQPYAGTRTPQTAEVSPPRSQNLEEPRKQPTPPVTPDPSTSLPVKTPPPNAAESSFPPQQATLPLDKEWKGQAVTVLRGDTISDIVFKMYGNYNVLALDLIKEFNPRLEDLDNISVGAQLWLPALTYDTLLRKQQDGSYHLIIGAFHGVGEAERAVRAARRQGYVSTITQRKISGTRVLYRVKLEQLRDQIAADHAWSIFTKRKT